MGWYFRKSVSAGPFRMNFSKSGISYSFGVKGARINTGRRGTYVSFGSNGIYYRKKVFVNDTPREYYNSQSDQELILQEPHTITSGPIEQITDTDSQHFVNELNERAKKLSYLKWLGIPLTIALLVATTIYYNEEVKRDIEKTFFVQSQDGVNVRQSPNPKSKQIGKADPYTQYEFIDSTAGWNKIRFGDSIGYISTHYTRIDSLTKTIATYTRMELQPGKFAGALSGGLFICIFCCVFLAKQDKRRLTMEINYELDDTIKEVYDKFLTYFSDAAKSNRVWQIIHSQNTYDWKRNAGAGRLVNRVSARGIYTNKRPASYFKTNIQIPSLQLRGTELYFFPERLVVKKNSQFAAVFYKNLNIEKYSSRFIEEESVPPDAQIVDYTWKFVNKNGGPDRRFNNNRRLPVCYYSYYSFTSHSGIYETICTSRNGAFDNFSQFVTAIGEFQKRMELN